MEMEDCGVDRNASAACIRKVWARPVSKGLKLRNLLQAIERSPRKPGLLGPAQPKVTKPQNNSNSPIKPKDSGDKLHLSSKSLKRGFELFYQLTGAKKAKNQAEAQTIGRSASCLHISEADKTLQRSPSKEKRTLFAKVKYLHHDRKCLKQLNDALVTTLKARETDRGPRLSDIEQLALICESPKKRRALPVHTLISTPRAAAVPHFSDLEDSMLTSLTGISPLSRQAESCRRIHMQESPALTVRSQLFPVARTTLRRATFKSLLRTDNF